MPVSVPGNFFIYFALVCCGFFLLLRLMKRKKRVRQQPSTTITAAGNSSNLGAMDTIEKSPMVGTVYLSKDSESPPYVNVGDRVRQGDVLCTIEAMKMFNEVRASYSGVVSALCVQSGQSVEYGQPLFILQHHR